MDLHKGTVPLSGTQPCEKSKPEFQKDRGDTATKQSRGAFRREMPAQGFKKFCCFFCDKILIFYIVKRLQRRHYLPRPLDQTCVSLNGDTKQKWFLKQVQEGLGLFGL